MQVHALTENEFDSIRRHVGEFKRDFFDELIAAVKAAAIFLG